MELLSFIFVLFVVALGTRATLVGLNGHERKWIWVAFLSHVLGAIIQVLITEHYFGGGDMTAYYHTGAALRDLVLSDVSRWAGSVAHLAMGGDPWIPFYVIGKGSSTGAISGITAWALLLGAGSIYGVCLLFGSFALMGQIALYRAAREMFPPVLRNRLILAVFFMPSVIFWSSGILKEPLSLGGLGLCVLGIWRVMFTGNRVRGAIILAVGLIAVGTIKPYTLFPLAAATAVWGYWSKRSRGWSTQGLVRNSIYVGITMVTIVVGLQYLGEVYPEYALDTMMERTAQLQGLYYEVGGGSTYQVGAATAEAQPTNAPLALATVLFRPLIFEAHNIISLFSAFEMTFIIVMMIQVLRKQGLRQAAQRSLRSPVLVFFGTFVVLLGVGIGLGAPNLGSLSRYRIPLMPFYVIFVLTLLPARARAQVKRPTLSLAKPGGENAATAPL